MTSESPLTEEEIIQKALDKDIIDTDFANVEDITDDEDEKTAFADVTYPI